MKRASRLPSLFDVLGPIMTGPSSSHTAGVLRIGLMARGLLGATPDRIVINLFGALSHTFKGHCTDSGIVAGLLGFPTEAPEVAEALLLAARRGIEVEYRLDPASTRHPNTVELHLEKAGLPPTQVTGLSVGGGEILITDVDGFAVELFGNEDGFMLAADRAIAEGEIAGAYGDRLSQVSVIEKDGRYLHICLTPQPAEDLPGALGELDGVRRVYRLPRVLDYSLLNSEPLFSSFEEALELARERNVDLVRLALDYEKKRSGLSEETILAMIDRFWSVMKKSVDQGLSGPNPLLAGFATGRDGQAMLLRAGDPDCFSGELLGRATAGALAVMEQNGCMGCVVASPTAGSCGVLAGTMAALFESRGLDQDQIRRALLCSAVVGAVIGQRVPMSGAVGGCQAEMGIASAMTAAALCSVAGGSPAQCVQGAVLSIKNILGLICDPVAGPVEVPCIKRNAIGTANAFIHADLAMAGIESVIPPDEVIDAMLNVQQLMPTSLRGTLEGGLPSTATGRRLKEEWAEILRRRAEEAASGK